MARPSQKCCPASSNSPGLGNKGNCSGGEKKTLGCQNEAYQTSLKQAQESKAEAEGQLAEALELQTDFYAREVALKVQVTSLQNIVEAYEKVQKDLKARCCKQTGAMERMEGEMASQTQAMGLLRGDYDKLQIEVNRLRVEKEALEKQVASGDTIIGELEKDKKTCLLYTSPSPRD